MPLPSFLIKRHPLSRGIRIRIAQDGTCTVTAHKRVPVWMINQFVEAKAGWINEHVAKAKSRPQSLLRGGTKADYTRLKTQALKLVKSRLDHFNTFYKLAYKKVAIRNQKTRWGSCSSTGTLCFNYRVVHLLPEQVDYIVVHELCHLAQMNHSVRFWRLVEQTIPNHRQIRAKIRHGDKLTEPIF